MVLVALYSSLLVLSPSSLYSWTTSHVWRLMHKGVTWPVFGKAGWVLALNAAAILSGVSMQLSPIPTLMQVHASSSTGALDGLPFVMLALSSGLCYGHMSGDLALVWTNIVGVSLGFAYVALFHFYCHNSASLMRLKVYLQAIAVSLLALFALTLACPRQRAVQVVGAVCSVLQSLTYAAPLSTVWEVIASRSTRALPAPLCCMGFASASVWLIYGLAVSDEVLIVPNLLGVVCGAMQLCLLALYREEQYYALK
ncbi:unnamed protein product [Vitrella brassicaformis CCMP3155]|uniref:Sugar transporter SWEET1 n=1 Tax=Vitrella brassicaformis (strain CCMP3155) TaxID=1169540 RepID=A0A0G4H2Q0_VITBC|nr:unnamed protein product [Vitrella brassicaformis CCMP3155]|eukprot:CEM37939.1 unnamed protein product [Vitrella brassicaformis CCMP3155]